MLLNTGQKWSLGSVVLLVLFVTLVHQIQHSNTTQAFKIPSFPSISLTKGTVTQVPDIPNIVHFVHLIRGSDSEPVVEFPFRQFVAIYSAHYYLNPDKIYIHTNLEDHALGAAINASTSPYVRSLLKLPNIVFNYEYTPLKTTGRKDISELAHRADFIRTRVLKKWGGLYLDDDAYVVRDMKPLRESGFRTIAGRQEDGQICNAVIMTAPESSVISLFYTLQDRIFDGGWTTHSVGLLTRLAHDFSGVDREMLILEREVFYRLGFNKEDLTALYHIYSDDRGKREEQEEGKDVNKDNERGSQKEQGKDDEKEKGKGKDDGKHKEDNKSKGKDDEKGKDKDDEKGKEKEKEKEKEKKKQKQKEKEKEEKEQQSPPEIITGPPHPGPPRNTRAHCQNLTSYIAAFQNPKKEKHREQQIDWRGSYIIHGWTTTLISYDNEENIMFGVKGGITLDYVLGKQSRFASAVYRAVRHAVDEGLLVERGDELEVSRHPGQGEK